MSLLSFHPHQACQSSLSTWTTHLGTLCDFFGGYPVHGQELDSMILWVLLQLRIFYDSAISTFILLGRRGLDCSIKRHAAPSKGKGKTEKEGSGVLPAVCQLCFCKRAASHFHHLAVASASPELFLSFLGLLQSPASSCFSLVSTEPASAWYSPSVCRPSFPILRKETAFSYTPLK